MRKLLPLIFLIIAIPAMADPSKARPVPKDATPLEEPPPPPEVKENAEKEPKITTRKDGDTKIEEFRIRGTLYKMRVTPAKGPAYWMIDEKGDGKFVRVDGPELKVKPAMWTILEWK